MVAVMVSTMEADEHHGICFTGLNVVAMKTHTVTNTVMLVWKSVDERSVGGGGEHSNGTMVKTSQQR